MALHKDLVDGNLHVLGYRQASDPGTVGAGKLWIDTTGGAGAWVVKIRDAANTGWETSFVGIDKNAIHDDVAAEISAITEKTSLAINDLFLIEDSAASNVKKKVKASNLIGDDADAIHDNRSGEIAAITEKTTLADDDLFLIEDSADSNSKRRVKKSTIATDAPDYWTTPKHQGGVLDLKIVCVQTLHIAVSGGGTDSGIVTPADFLRSIQGGVSSPTWTYSIRKDGESWGTFSGNNHGVYVTFDNTEAGYQVPCEVAVSDGTTTAFAAVSVVVSDADGLGGGGY